MPFTREDIEFGGYVPDTTVYEYSVSLDGEHIGRVRLSSAVSLLNSGQDPRDYIARRLTEVESNEGFDKLASALGATLQM
jgi:hypothetical protein